MRKQPEIEQEIDRLEEAMLETPATDPKWSALVKKRHLLLIELEQAQKPVEKQKSTYLTPLKFLI